MAGAVQHVFSSPLAESSVGVYTVFNSNGVSTTMSGSQLLGASEWNSTHQMSVTLSGNTLNASTVSGTDVILAASGALSLSGTSNTIVLTAANLQTLSAWGVPQIEAAPINFAAAAGPDILFPGNNNIIFGCFTLPAPLSITQVQIPFFLSQTTTVFNSYSSQFGVAIYTLTGSTYSLLTSATAKLTISYTSSPATAFSVTYSDSAGSTSYTMASAGTSIITKQKLLQIDLATTLAPGVPSLLAFSMSSAGGTNLSGSIIPLPIYSTTGQGLIGTNQGTASLSLATQYDRLLGGLFNITSANAFPASISTSGLSAPLSAGNSQFALVAQMLAS